MTLIKSWLVTQWDLGDGEWLAENNIKYQPKTEKIPFAQGKSVHYMAGRSGLVFETTTDEQEMLVRLKFEPGLVLMMETVVMPQDY